MTHLKMGTRVNKCFLIAGKRSAVRKHQWYVDSGCSRHMIGSKDSLINYRSCEDPRVNFGGDEKGNVVGKEDLVI